MRLIENDMASLAYEQVRDVAERRPRETRNEFKSAARSFPAIVVDNGLMAAAAILLARRGRGLKKNRSTERGPDGWVIYHDAICSLPEADRIIRAIEQADGPTTAEETLGQGLKLQALAGWMKRAAESLLIDDEASMGSTEGGGNG
jgi:CRISPR type III-B/RAMP module-associated protein Cmr5